MRLRWTGALLLLVAGGLSAGVAAPVRREATAFADELRRMRGTRRDARARVVGLERQESLRRRAIGALGGTDGAAGGAPAVTRRAVLAALEGLPVSGVRLDVRAGTAPVAATVRLSAEGPTADILRLTGRLARAGLVFSQVRFAPAAAGVLLDLEGLSPGGST